jgi:DNA-binding MarR family transcriptional regulator
MDELEPLIAGERASFASHCHERSISMAHLHLMTVLAVHGPQSMGWVAERLGTGLPTATGLVTRMEERGLVERVRDGDDRRVVLVRLTETGAGELSELQATRRRRMAAALARLSAAEQDRLLSALRSLRSAFEHLHEQGATHA